jgi:phosphoribosylglycinamide formyltransferase-1
MADELTRIAVLVSGGGTNLQALIDAEKSGIIKSGRIVLVASNNRDAYALKRAQQNDIETYLMKDEKDLLEKLESRNIELIVLAGFMKILSADFISHYPQRIINIHPSLIPSFCGKGCYGIHVHEKALAYGVKVTGATVHFVNEIPDGGKIISQKAVEIRDDDTPETLQKRVMKQAEWILLPRATEKISCQIKNEKNRK